MQSLTWPLNKYLLSIYSTSHILLSSLEEHEGQGKTVTTYSINPIFSVLVIFFVMCPNMNC